MENSNSIRQLLETYYERFAQKKGWEQVISDDFKYVGGDMTKTEPLSGKEEYIKVIKRFSQVYETMRVKSMMIDGQRACVIGNYDLTFPNGVTMNSDVAEIWTAKSGKLSSLRIFFDTLTFANNAPK